MEATTGTRDDPNGPLEQLLIGEYLESRGQTRRTVRDLPEREALSGTPSMVRGPSISWCRTHGQTSHRSPRL